MDWRRDYCRLLYRPLFFFRLKTHRQVEVTEYEPPKGITPAIAYVVENGRSERAVAAVLVSLCAKGFLTIQEDGDWCTVRKKREDDGTLPAEASTILKSLGVEGARAYTFNAAEDTRLCTTCTEFKGALDGIVRPDLISEHWAYWLAGLACTLVTVAPVAESMPTNNASWGSVAFLGIWILLGGSSLVAALRVWPLTLRKLVSYIPWDEKPSSPSDLNEFRAAADEFGGGQCVGPAACMAPTREGRKALAELENFREFLARTDSDLMNRENLPVKRPRRSKSSVRTLWL